MLTLMNRLRADPDDDGNDDGNDDKRSDNDKKTTTTTTTRIRQSRRATFGTTSDKLPTANG